MKQNRSSLETVNALYDHHNTLKIKVDWDFNIYGGEIVVTDRKTGHEFAHIAELMVNSMPINDLLFFISVMRNSFFDGLITGEEKGKSELRSAFKKLLGE